MRARALIEKGEQTCPRSDTVLLSLLSLIVFLISAVFALVIPTTMVKQLIFALNGTVASVLGATLAIDLMTSMYHDPSTQESES
jgi:prepilin signal peptidase PulO-like enzyme (type II secretory pathway)